MDMTDRGSRKYKGPEVATRVTVMRPVYPDQSKKKEEQSGDGQKGSVSKSVLGLLDPGRNLAFTLSQESCLWDISASRMCSHIQTFNEPGFQT